MCSSSVESTSKGLSRKISTTKETIHTATGWTSYHEYGLYIRTKCNEKGEGAGYEIKVGEVEVK